MRSTEGYLLAVEHRVSLLSPVSVPFLVPPPITCSPNTFSDYMFCYQRRDHSNVSPLSACQPLRCVPFFCVTPFPLARPDLFQFFLRETALYTETLVTCVLSPLLLGTRQAIGASPGFCMQCKTERATRVCDQCIVDRRKKLPWGGGKLHLCFVCFAVRKRKGKKSKGLPPVEDEKN